MKQGLASGSTADSPLCRVKRASKWYGPVIAVNDVSLDLQAGITGLVGPNGAGKSTLIKLLTGQLRPSLGRVEVWGLSSWSARAKSHVGYCVDADAFYEEMSGRRFVRTMARLHGYTSHEASQRAEAVLEQVGMIDRADRPLGSYSKGMRQRIKLAQALVHDPDLVVLDEPLNGVDPVGRMELVALFKQLSERGKAVLVSSHILEEMDRLADRILFICRGRVLAQGSLAEIREMLADHPLRVRLGATDPRGLAARLFALPSVRGVEIDSWNELLVEVEHAQQFFSSIHELVIAGHCDLQRMRVEDASMEAIFDYLLKSAGP